MKSIRLSLVVYFLVLLAGALLAVGWSVYRTTENTLLEKEKSTRTLFEAQYESRCRAVEEEFDRHMLRRAQMLANLAKSQWNPLPREFYVTSLLTAPVHPDGQALMPVSTILASGPFGERLFGRAFLRIDFAEDVMAGDPERQDREYFQIYFQSGVPLQRSQSMGESSFVLDRATRDSLDLLDWQFDDTELRSGVHVRRITLKAPVSHFRRWKGPGRRVGAESTAGTKPPGTKPPGTKPPGTKPPGGFTEGSAPAIFIQCAYDTKQKDAVLAGLGEKLQNDLADLEADSKARLADLRRRLFWIGLGSFAAVMLGSFWLVRAGLSPLRRLSDAVSRVSERNFRLELQERRLPSELRPIVERLTQTLNLLQRAFAREKQAAADISHELRTPLAALLTTIEVALRKVRSPEEYRELLEDCRNSSHQMTQLVERLLALARLDAGADTLRRREIDVLSLAEQCAALVRPLAEARGLRLQVHGQGPARVSADPDKLREVLTNLLHNAIQYNRPRGTVELTVERQNGQLRLEVRDTGIGIAPQVREHIFERFYRADPSRHADGVHAGLGLAIVKGYVELMGGKIIVQSSEGQGSTFCVHLPVS